MSLTAEISSHKCYREDINICVSTGSRHSKEPEHGSSWGKISPHVTCKNSQTIHLPRSLTISKHVNHQLIPSHRKVSCPDRRRETVVTHLPTCTLPPVLCKWCHSAYLPVSSTQTPANRHIKVLPHHLYQSLLKNLYVPDAVQE